MAVLSSWPAYWGAPIASVSPRWTWNGRAYRHTEWLHLSTPALHYLRFVLSRCACTAAFFLFDRVNKVSRANRSILIPIFKIGGNAADTSAAQCLDFLSCGPSRGKHQLLELSMHSLHFGDDGARSLVAGFEAGCLHSIQALNMSHNDITCHGCEILADAIEKYSMPNIQELLLTGNQIGDRGVRASMVSCNKLIIVQLLC